MSEPESWRCVRDGIPPPRSAPVASPRALPADLVHLLVSRVGLREAEVADMSRDAAIARLQQYWTDGS